MIAAGTLHDNLLLSRGFFAPQRVQSSHNGLFGYPRPPLTADSTQRGRASDLGKTVRLDDLEKYGYAIDDKMGSIHIESGKVTFSSLSGIREAYAQAFSKDYDAIDEALNDETLDVVSQVRHVIVHKAGRVDDDYLARTASLSGAPGVTAGEQLLLDGETVGLLLGEILQCGSNLVDAVDRWLLAHPTSS